MRRALLVLVASCALPPAPIANHAARPAPIVDADLESLSFLVGCWSYWNVDWGFRMCWKREHDAWIGHYVSGGPMGPSSKTKLRIARSDLGLTLTTENGCEPALGHSDQVCDSAYVGPPRAASPPACDRFTKEACALGEPLVMFGTGENTVWLGRDVAHDRLLFGARYVKSMTRAH